MFCSTRMPTTTVTPSFCRQRTSNRAAVAGSSMPITLAALALRHACVDLAECGVPAIAGGECAPAMTGFRALAGQRVRQEFLLLAGGDRRAGGGRRRAGRFAAARRARARPV